MNGAGWAVTLARLALRRALPPLVLAGTVLLLLVVRWREEARAQELGALLAANAQDPAAAVRAALWSLSALVFVPFAVVRAARTFARWRAGELDFLAPRAAPRAGIVGATFGGHLGAFGLLLLCVLLVSELGRTRAPSFADAGTVPLPRSGWITGRSPFEARLGPAVFAPGTRLELEFVLGAGAGPAAEVVVRAERPEPVAYDARDRSADPGRAASRAREARQHLGTRGRIEVEVPPGPGELVLGVTLTDPAARVFLAVPAARVWRPVDDARRASLVLALELVLLAAAAGAVALGFAAFVAPAIAAAGTLALALAPGLAGLEPAWLPGHGLFDALTTAGRARVPAAPGWERALASALLVAAGIALASASRAGWRRTR